MTGGEDGRELGRRLVERLAPEELPLFDRTWELLRRPRRRRAPREEPLGFGIPDVDALLVTAVVSGVVSTVLADLARDAGSWSVRFWWRLRRRRRPAPAAPLEAARLVQIHEIARDRAVGLGMAETDALALADAVVSELARGDAEP